MLLKFSCLLCLSVSKRTFCLQNSALVDEIICTLLLNGSSGLVFRRECKGKGPKPERNLKGKPKCTSAATQGLSASPSSQPLPFFLASSSVCLNCFD